MQHVVGPLGVVRSTADDDESVFLFGIEEHGAAQTIGTASMAHQRDTRHIIVGQPEIQAVVFGFGARDLHVAGTLLGDDADAVGRGSVVHVHRHVAGQVEGRDLHAACRREDQGVVSHLVVRHFLAAGRVGFFVVVDELACFVIPGIEVGEAAFVERIHAIAAIEAQRAEHMVHDILVEAFARHALENGSGQVEIEVAVLVAAAARFIIVVAASGFGVQIGIDDVDGGPVSPVVVDARRMGEEHFEGDDGVGELWVAYLEAEQVAYVVGQRQLALFDLLEQARSGKGFGNRGNPEDRLVVHRFFCLEVFHPEIVVIDDLVVLDDGTADTDRFDFSKICSHIFFKFLFGRLASGEQQGGHEAGGKKAFFHFSMVLSVLSAGSSGFLRKNLPQR